MDNPKRVILTITILCVLLSGCGIHESKSDIQDMNSSLGETPKEISPTLTPTSFTWWKTPPPPLPTLSKDLQEEFFYLLETNGGCKLPCFLNILPGETSLQTAISLLKRFDTTQTITRDEETRAENTTSYYAHIITSKDVFIDLIVRLEVKSNIVERIFVDIDLTQNIPPGFLDEQLNWYALHDIFIRHGYPDNMVIIPPNASIDDSAYTLYALYLSQKIMFSLTGWGNKNDDGGYTICPNLSDGEIGYVKFVLANTNDPEDIRSYQLMVPYVEGDGFSVAINTALGMTDIEFYDSIISNQRACFNIIE